MPSCVTEGSYNLLFIVAIIVSVLFLISTAYYYDKFSKATTNRLTENQANIAKNMTMISLIVALFSIAILFLFYFGFQTRMVGVYTPTVGLSTPRAPMKV